MRQRGRQSATSLQVVPISVLDRVPRLKPLPELSHAEVEVWKSVVNGKPADWFSSDTAGVLIQYCRHFVHARNIAGLIEKALSDTDPDTGLPTLNMDDYGRLLKMQALESREIRMLATTLRITPHSQTNHRGNKKPSTSRKPWES